jgi:hypothetical protein
MDVRIETTPMGAVATMVTALVRSITRIIHKTIKPVQAVVSFVRLSLHGVSLSAVAPDKNILGGTA